MGSVRLDVVSLCKSCKDFYVYVAKMFLSFFFSVVGEVIEVKKTSSYV